MRDVNPFTVYVILRLCSSLLFSLIFAASFLYHVTVVQLNPLQLVPVATSLDTTIPPLRRSGRSGGGCEESATPCVRMWGPLLAEQHR